MTMGPSMAIRRTSEVAIGLGRRGERRAKVPCVGAVVLGVLDEQVAAGFVHPVEDFDGFEGVETLEGFIVGFREDQAAERARHGCLGAGNRRVF